MRQLTASSDTYREDVKKLRRQVHQLDKFPVYVKQYIKMNFAFYVLFLHHNENEKCFN